MNGRVLTTRDMEQAIIDLEEAPRVSRERIWLKLVPEFDYGHRQTGWKVAGVTRKQPSTGHAVCLDLNIPFPAAVRVEFQEKDIHVETETQREDRRVVEALDPEPQPEENGNWV